MIFKLFITFIITFIALGIAIIVHNTNEIEKGIRILVAEKVKFRLFETLQGEDVEDELKEKLKNIKDDFFN